MRFLGDFHFIRPAWLLLIPLVVLVWWLERRWQDPQRGWLAVMDRELLAAMTVGGNTKNRWARDRSSRGLVDRHHRGCRTHLAARTVAVCR